MSIRSNIGSGDPGTSSTNQSGSSNSQNFEISISKILQMLRRHKLVLLIPIIVGQLIGIYSYLVLVTYTAGAQILIQKADNSSLQALSADLGANKMAMMNSMKNDNYLETSLLFLRASDFYEFAAAEILETNDGKILASSMVNKVPTLLYYTNRLLGRKQPISKVREVSPKLFSKLLRSTTQFSKSASNGIYVTVTTSDPKLSTSIATLMTEKAIKMLTRRDLIQLEAAKTYVSTKLEEISSNMQEIEAEMLRIRKKTGSNIGATSSQANAPLNAITIELESNRVKLEQNEKLIASISKSIESNQKRRAEEEDSENEDPVTLSILSRQMLALEARKNGLLAEGNSPESTQVIQLEEEIEKNRELLKSSRSNTKNVANDDSSEFLKDETNPELRLSNLRKENWYLKTNIAAARRIIAANKLEKANLPEEEQRYFALTKRLEMRYILFGELSKQLFNTDVNRISIQNKVVQLDKQQPENIIRKPGLMPTLPLALILAILIGSTIALIIEKNDPILSSRKDVPGFNYIFLGSIPKLADAGKSKSGKESFLRSVLLRHKLDLPQTIPFKRIRTRLLHLNRTVNDKSKIIAITSTHPADGKSFVSANMAASMAASGKKVLLIDTDLRKKALSRELAHQSSPGLSAYLTESKPGAYEKYMTLKIQDNLDFFPSGSSVNNSTELLNTPRFASLLKELALRYDFIFIDNPPFMALPDSEIVASHSDIVILNLACNKTKVHDVSTMMEHFLQDGDKPVCVTLNFSTEKAPLYYGTSNESARVSVAA